LVGCLLAWLFASLLDGQSVVGLLGSFVGWLSVWLIGWVVGWFVAWLPVSLFGRLVVWFIGYLFFCLVGWLLVYFVGCLITAVMYSQSQLDTTKFRKAYQVRVSL
jgi:hypothetical protein